MNPDPHQFGKLDPDPHRSGKQDPDPRQSERHNPIRIRIKGVQIGKYVSGRIWIKLILVGRIRIRNTVQKVEKSKMLYTKFNRTLYAQFIRLNLLDIRKFFHLSAHAYFKAIVNYLILIIVVLVNVAFLILFMYCRSHEPFHKLSPPLTPRIQARHYRTFVFRKAEEGAEGGNPCVLQFPHRQGYHAIQ